jgi:pimeloyl-ACP methyl ester carboxylesterase
MFRNLIPELATEYHVIAPDYPGFGASDMPDAADYEYSFANTAAIITELLDQKNVEEYAVYLMDYGAPVGFRMFAEHPERVSGFIIQNGNAYEEGLREFWDPLKAYWADPSSENGDQLRGFLEMGATKWQFTHGTQNPEAISPDNFWHVQYLLDRPGNQEVQLEMFLDYGTNVAEYPKWQALFREHQTPTLLMWGKNDHIFPADGAYPYKRDLDNIAFHLLNTGHFALEEYGSEIAAEMIEFMDQNTNP